MTPIANKELPDNIKKFLMLITFTEGTDKFKKPYNTLFTHKTFSDLSKHPNIKIASGKYVSTAAGRYQILYRTYLDLGGKSFDPVSQDNLAVKLLKRRGAYQLILEGKFKEAILKCNREWASLPESPYGQPTHTMESVLKFISDVKL